MRQGGHVFDCSDVDSGSLQASNGAFAARPGTFDSNFHFFHTKFHCPLGTSFSGALGGKGGAFSTSFETRCSSSCPTQNIAIDIGDGNGCIIESCFDVRNGAGYISPYSAPFGLCHALFSKIIFCLPSFLCAAQRPVPCQASKTERCLRY